MQQTDDGANCMLQRDNQSGMAKHENSHAVACRRFVAQWSERLNPNRKTLVRTPAGLRCVFRLIQLSAFPSLSEIVREFEISKHFVRSMFMITVLQVSIFAQKHLNIGLFDHASFPSVLFFLIMSKAAVVIEFF